MSDPQPWRNPRPAPQLPEMQPRLHKLLIPAWLRAWWPAVAWAVVIFTLSTDSFSSDHTATVLSFFVKWLFPHLTEDQFNFIHHIIRKSAHFTEYFIFCMLDLPRRPRRSQRLALDLGHLRPLCSRRLFHHGRNPSSLRRQPHRLALRFPARLHRRVLRLRRPLLLVPLPPRPASARR